MRLWIGIGGRHAGATLIFQPFVWRWSWDGISGGLLREFYLGPVTIQLWEK